MLDYQYQSLSPCTEDSHTIRLMELQPGVGPIKFSLTHVRLEDEIQYQALSYTWGDPNDTTSVTRDSMRLSITKNLETALYHLRHSESSRRLWVDAVCINQSDHLEKGEQINLMRTIYQRAEETVVWLGQSDDETEIAIRHIKEQAGKVEDRTCKKSDNKLDPRQREEAALKNLLCRIWFNRIWVVQEVAVSKEVSVHCGRFSVAWEELSKAVRKISQGFEVQQERGTTYQSMFDQRERFQTGSRQDLLSLATMHQNCQATLPSDKIYALHGLASAGSSACPIPRIIPNIRPDHLYQDWTIQYLKARRKLDILRCTNGLGNGHKSRFSGLPSWVPDWSTTRTRYSLSLVEVFSDWTRTFASTAGSTCCPDLSADGRALWLDGYEIDKIAKIGHAHEKISRKGRGHYGTEVNPFFEWIYTMADGLMWHLEMEAISGVRTERTYVTGENLVETFWQTLCAGSKEHCYSSIREEFMTWDKDMSALSFLHKLHLTSSRPFILILIVGFYVRRTLLYKVPTIGISQIPSMQAGASRYSFKNRLLFTQGRKMVKTVNGYLALVPQESCDEDRIWIFKGGKVPLVLRPVGKDENCFRLVGEAYVHGAMHGESYEEAKCERVELI